MATLIRNVQTVGNTFKLVSSVSECPNGVHVKGVLSLADGGSPFLHACSVHFLVSLPAIIYGNSLWNIPRSQNVNSIYKHVFVPLALILYECVINGVKSHRR